MVDSTEQKDVLREHEFDGIQEYDNPLPRWWVWMLYGTICFAMIYLPYYHLFGGKLPRQEYEEEVAKVAEQRKKQAQAAMVTSAPAADEIAAGKAIFQANCIPCHGPNGEGGIGPNLTDNFWLHGNKREELAHTVTEGMPDKGMVAWKTLLGPQKINQVVSYIQSLSGTNPANAKAPQGIELAPQSAAVTTASAVEEAGDKEAGKAIYQSNCIPCHGPIGEGGIGPNLTDKFWLHGNTTAQVIKTVTDGVPDKGMVSWKTVLGPKKIRDVVAYVQTLQGTNPPNAKEPQGVEVP